MYKTKTFLLICLCAIMSQYCYASSISESGNTIIISNDFATITLNNDGTMASVQHQGKEYHQDTNSSENYFARIYYDHLRSSFDDANSITLLVNNTLELGFANSAAKIHVQILLHDRYFSFQLIKAINFDATIKRVRFFHVNYTYDITRRATDFIKTSHEDTLFMNTLPMNTETVTGHNYAETNVRAGFESSQAAIIISPKKHYKTAIKTMIANYGLPDVRMNGVWFRESPVHDESYLFAKLTQDNYLEVLAYCQRMKVPNLLIISPFRFGHYNQPRSTSLFPDIESFFTACDAFNQAGIKLGIHSHFSHVSARDPFFLDPARNIMKYEIGTLAADITENSNTLTLTQSLDNNDTFKTYQSTNTLNSVLINGEVMRFSAQNNNNINISGRGFHSTKTAHSAGASVYILPYKSGEYYLNTHNPDVVDEYVQSISATLKRINVKFLYYDGASYPELVEGGGKLRQDFANLHYKYGVLPLMQSLGTDDIRYQFGESSGQFGYYFISRVASWDGVEHGNKNFTKLSKVPLASDFSLLPAQRELGWWKIHGSQISINSKKFNTDAVTVDDVHYVMMKALSLHRGVGTQLASLYTNHAQLDSIMDLIGTYNDFIALDNIIPQISNSYREHLARFDIEAELTKVGQEYKIIEKKVVEHYARWSSSTDFSFTFHNPFKQKNAALIKIKPRFDYYPFNDNQHQIIEDFSDISDWEISTKNNDVTCTMSDGGTVTLQNNGSPQNWVKLQKFIDVDMSGKRGVGISVDGLSGGEVIIVQLSGQGLDFFGQFGYRDYRFDVDFTGTQELMLGDPLRVVRDYYADSSIYFNYSPNKRFWTFNYSTVKSVTIYIGNIQTGAAYNLQFNELKALQEKGDSELRNPVITINNVNGTTSCSFPETLSISEGAAYLIEYDGSTGDYDVLDADHKILYSGTTTQLEVLPGDNTITLTSNLAPADSTSRAFIDLSVYDKPSQERGLYWSFDESSSTSVFDRNKSNNHGLMKNMMPSINRTTGFIGKSVTFTSPSQSIECPSSTALTLSGTMSLDCWIKPSAYSTGYSSQIVSKWSSTDDANFAVYFFGDESGGQYKNIAVFANAGNSWKRVSPYYRVYELNKWMHLAWTYSSASGGDLYIDGQRIGNSSIGGGTLATNTAPLRVAQGGYIGSIDELRIVDYVLSSEEIFDRFDTVGHWEFEEGAGLSTQESTEYHLPSMLTDMQASSSWTSGETGNALQYPGTGTRHLNAGNTQIFAGQSAVDELNIDFWIYPSAWHSGYAAHPLRKHTSTTESTFLLYFHGDTAGSDNRKLIFRGTTIDTDGVITWRGLSARYEVPAINQWYHIQWNYSAIDGGQLYVDGVAIGGRIGNGKLIVCQDNIKVGSAFTGKVDSLIIRKKQSFSGNTAPIINSLSPAHNSTFNVGDTVTFEAIATDADNDTLTYTWVLDGNIIPGTSSQLVHTIASNRYKHSMYVRVSDSKGGTDARAIDYNVNVSSIYFNRQISINLPLNFGATIEPTEIPTQIDNTFTFDNLLPLNGHSIIIDIESPN